ncbi:MAG: hypothetical protein Kow0022_13820 [Phycisphaerales bacterium]
MSRLFVVVVFLLLAVWVMGQVLTDEYRFSQYAWWLPVPILLAVCWPMVAASWVLERCSARLGGYQLRPVLSAALLGITLWFVFGVGRFHRLVWPRGSGSIRLVYWNLAVDGEANGAGEVVLGLDPDVAVVANPRWDQTRKRLFDAMRRLGSVSAVPEGEPEPNRFVFTDEIALATRGQIRRWGSVRFGVGGRDDFEHRGVIVFAQLADLAPEPITIWVVDLPSDPTLWRMDVMKEAQQAIGAWSGPDFVAGEGGGWVRRVQAEPFPKPDVVVGDFNTPRGSASLKILIGDRQNAWKAQGRGFGYTWPRERALLAIDQCFVGPALRVRGFRTLDPGMGRHRLLVADLDPD